MLNKSHHAAKHGVRSARLTVKLPSRTGRKGGVGGHAGSRTSDCRPCHDSEYPKFGYVRSEFFHRRRPAYSARVSAANGHFAVTFAHAK